MRDSAELNTEENQSKNSGEESPSRVYLNKVKNPQILIETTQKQKNDER